MHAEGTSSLRGHPHCTYYREGQDPANGRFNLWLPSDPGALPRGPSLCWSPPLFSPKRGSTLWELRKMVESPPHTSVLAPSLATCLEAKLGEIPSWNFSFRGWDEILPTGRQLRI